MCERKKEILPSLPFPVDKGREWMKERGVWWFPGEGFEYEYSQCGKNTPQGVKKKTAKQKTSPRKIKIVLKSYYYCIQRPNSWMLLGQSLNIFPPCYSQSTLLTDFTLYNPPHPPPPFSKISLTLVCNVNIANGNLKYESSRGNAQNLNGIVLSWIPSLD